MTPQKRFLLFAALVIAALVAAAAPSRGEAVEGKRYNNLDRKGVAYDMMNGVKRFALRCWDGEEWVDQWQTDPQDPRLPLAVALEIAWARGEGEAEELLVTTTPVYAAAGRNPSAPTGGGGAPAVPGGPGWQIKGGSGGGGTTGGGLLNVK